MTRPALPRTIEALLVRTVAQPHPILEKPCRIWQGTTRHNGHGQFYGRIGKNGEQVHRLVCKQAHGLEGDQQARHVCDVSLCIEPTHLTPGSHEDNMKDRDVRGRTAKGSKHGCAILTEEQVAEIESTPNVYGSGVKLAKKFGVSSSTISAVRHEQNWK